jgi:hypothetical protein
MNSEIKALVDSNLFNSLLQLAKDDIVLQKTLERTSSTKEFINSLIAALICIKAREEHNHFLIAQVLDANPAVKDILKIKNDPSLLSQGEAGADKI